ncbi:hypothetical protein TNCV_3370531 [Trichonephila clavipes]|nr:hypothetical protein TNCV_3370531 [Trichonephila clavipes]
MNGTQEHPLALCWKSIMNYGSQTALAKLRNSYLKCLPFESGRKVHPTCKKCYDHPASPDHSEKHWTLKRVLTSDPLVIEFWRSTTLWSRSDS